MANSEDRYVLLKGGGALPLEPLLLSLELEERGFTLTKESDDTLSVQPYQRLTREDCARIRQWKAHILAIIAYDAGAHEGVIAVRAQPDANETRPRLPLLRVSTSGRLARPLERGTLRPRREAV